MASIVQQSNLAQYQHSLRRKSFYIFTARSVLIRYAQSPTEILHCFTSHSSKVLHSRWHCSARHAAHMHLDMTCITRKIPTFKPCPTHALLHLMPWKLQSTPVMNSWNKACNRILHYSAIALSSSQHDSPNLKISTHSHCHDFHVLNKTKHPNYEAMDPTLL